MQPHEEQESLDRGYAWLAVWIGIIALGAGATWLLFFLGEYKGTPENHYFPQEWEAAEIVAAVMTLVRFAWECYGFWSWRQKRWVQFLAVWEGINLLGGGLFALLFYQGHPSLGLGLVVALAVLNTLWLYFGFWCWRDRRWIKWTTGYFTVGLLVLGLCAILLSLSYNATAVAFAGVWAMAMGFLLGVLVIRLLLSFGWPVFGVARTVVDEAIRMKVVLVFMVVLVLIIPILPISLSPRELLEYRIQSFLSWTLTIISILLAILTIFLSCSTICAEVKNHQIFLTMTKPVSRFEYLVGKWLGIVMLNMVLLAVSGIGVFAFANLLEMQPARSRDDRVAVDTQVLVARNTIIPFLPAGLEDKLIKEREEQLKLDDPERFKEGRFTAKDEQEIRTGILFKWHTVAPGNANSFFFAGLDKKFLLDHHINSVQLRFKPKASHLGSDARDHLAMFINNTGNPFPLAPDAQGRLQPVPLVVTDSAFQIQDIPVRYISDDGRLGIFIGNLDSSSVTFTPGDGLQIRYQVGTFGGNLVRGLALLAAQLAFLAMLGLAAGTFLGFPVAVLLSALVCFAAEFSDFLKEALQFYAGISSTSNNLLETLATLTAQFVEKIATGEFFESFKIVIRIIGESFIFFAPSFSQYDAATYLADGKNISIDLIAGALLRVGLVSTGACVVVGWIIFHRRELARIIV